jgi:2-amino-4-hydroxy-6-hydroxymethyldihydropteridine diphosphokinase
MGVGFYTNGVPSPEPVAIYLGLGSNLGDRRASIASAVRALEASGAVVEQRLSSLYETDAISESSQPAYLNAVLRGRTALAPGLLLERCLALETALGRRRPPGINKAPRTIDIDLLLYGDRVIRTRDLELPHPGLLARAFVLIPLAEVAAIGLLHPITGVSLEVARSSPQVRFFSAAI